MNRLRRILDWLSRPVEGFEPGGSNDEPQTISTRDLELCCADRLEGYGYARGFTYTRWAGTDADLSHFQPEDG